MAARDLGGLKAAERVVEEVIFDLDAGWPTRSRRRSPPGRSRGASRLPTSTSRPRVALASNPRGAWAIEDSSNGLRSAAAAGMTTIALPNPHYPPSADALALAAVTITTLHELTPELVANLQA